MFDRLNAIIRDIEESEQEIQILLKMHNLRFIDFIMIKRGSADFPENLEMWRFEQIDSEVSRLKDKINELNKLKKEFLVW